MGGWLKSHGVRFFPVVNWAERGVHGDGNSVPRFHLTWGCGQALVDAVWGAIQRHPAPLSARGAVRHPGDRSCCEEDGAVVRLPDRSRGRAATETERSAPSRS